MDWTCGNRCLSKSYQIVLSTNFYQMGTRDCQILSQKIIDMLSKSYQAFSIKQYHSLSNGFRSEKSSRACLGGQRFFECFYKWGNPQIINFKGTLHHKPAGLWHGHPSTLCHGSQTHAFPSELFRIQVWTKKISQTHPTSLQGTSLRDEYNKYLTNAMADLRLSHPSWLGHEVIAKAREMSGPYIIVIPLLRCVIS